MKDIEQQIEQMHQAGRQRLEHDCTTTEKTLPLLGSGSRPLWRYAAMLAAVAVVAALLLFPSRREQSTPVLAQNELPQTVKHQLQETLNQSNIQTTKHSDYAYTETTDGVRVYCEDNCNPDEVLNRMKQVIKTLQ